MNATDSIIITTNKDQININYVHQYLSNQSYWARGIPKELLIQAINNSLCFLLLKEGRQIGFARVISDYSTFAYLADVFIDPGEQGRGYAKQLMGEIMAHPQLQGLRRWMLMTADAHTLYEQFGFRAMAYPDRAMEIAKPNIYTNTEAG